TDGLEHRRIGLAGPVGLDTLALSDPDARVGGDALEEGLDDARLADARLAGHEDDLTLAAPGGLQPGLEPVQDRLPTHEVGRPPVSGPPASLPGGRGSTSVTSAMNRYPRRCTVATNRGAPTWSPMAFRISRTHTLSTASPTTVPGQTRSSSASLVTSWPWCST